MENKLPLKKINEPRVIIVSVVVILFLLGLVLKPILSKGEESKKKIRLASTKNSSIIDGLPKSYADIEPENKPISPPPIEPPKPTVQEEIQVKQNPTVIIQPVKKEPSEFEKALMDGKTSGISFPGFKPVKKKLAKENRHSITVSLKKPGSKYLIQAGTSISAITVTAINSGLPGHIVARVNRNIYDNISGQFLLIPQGSKLIGSYGSSIKLNQKRIEISWREIKLPDGSTVDLGKGQPGIGLQGMSGISGDIDNHFLSNAFSIFSVALLHSTANQISKSNKGTLEGDVSEDVAGDVADAGSDIFRQQIQLGPTIKIPIGSPVKVLVVNDLEFKEPYNVKAF